MSEVPLYVGTLGDSGVVTPETAAGYLGRNFQVEYNTRMCAVFHMVSFPGYEAWRDYSSHSTPHIP
jgi:hypothetical protein